MSMAGPGAAKVGFAEYLASSACAAATPGLAAQLPVAAGEPAALPDVAAAGEPAAALAGADVVALAAGAALAVELVGAGGAELVGDEDLEEPDDEHAATSVAAAAVDVATDIHFRNPNSRPIDLSLPFTCSPFDQCGRETC
jgi:hypothetical protein